MSIDVRTLGPWDTIFTHVYSDGRSLSIHPARLAAAAEAACPKPETFQVPISKDSAKTFLRDNIVDPVRCTKLKAELLKNGRLDPIIFCKDGGTTNGKPDALFVDGHHRYCVASLTFKLSAIPAYVLEEAFWRPFQITGMPPLSHNELRSIPTKRKDYRFG